MMVILGRQGSGKTYLTRSLVPHLPKPVIILDTMNEFTEGLQFLSVHHFADFILDEKQNSTGVYIVNVKTQGEAEQFLELVKEMKMEATVILDEASKFSNPHNIDNSFKELISYGRHYSVNIIATARRSTELHRDVTSQADVILSFKQTEKVDVDRLRSVHSGAEVVTTLDLDAHEYAVFGEVERLPFADQLDPAN